MIKCPKCDAVSGDDWTQCNGSCPMEGSPFFNRYARKVAAMKELVSIKEVAKKPVTVWLGPSGATAESGDVIQIIRTDNFDLIAEFVVPEIPEHACLSIVKKEVDLSDIM